MELLDVDEIQAQAILDMQLRRLAALERQKIIDELAEIERDHRRPAGHPGPPGAAAADRPRRAHRDRREARRRAAHPDRGRRRRRHQRGPDRGRGRGRHDHPDRLRQAHQDRPVPGAEARRQGRAGRHAEAGRHRRALLRVLHARLDAVLHHQGPGVPAQGLRAARGQPQRPRPARGQPAGLPARRAHRPGHADLRLPGRALPGAGHPDRPGEEVAADRLRLPALWWADRDQPARGRRAGRRGALLGRRRPAAGVGRGAVDPVHRHRRGAAPDGPGHVRVCWACGSTSATGCCRWRWCGRRCSCWSRRPAGTPSGRRSRTTRCRVGAARVC